MTMDSLESEDCFLTSEQNDQIKEAIAKILESMKNSDFQLRVLNNKILDSLFARPTSKRSFKHKDL